MIVIKLEFHRAGKGDVIDLGRAHIINDGSGDSMRGNYLFEIYKGAHYSKNTNKVWKRGRIRGWPRKSKRIGPWELLSVLLITALGDRISKATKMMSEDGGAD